MSVSELNPTFVGLGVTTPNILELSSPMPIGQYKGSILKYVIIDEPEYVRWFVNNVTKYELSLEAKSYLAEYESYCDSAIPPEESILDFDDDIPF